MSELVDGDAEGEDTNTAAERASHAVRAREHTILPAQTLGRYVVLSQLGASGSGQVYTAYDPRLDRRVALKLLRSSGDLQRLMRGARALGRLSDPHVVTVHEVDEHEGRPLIAMELVEGQTLKQWLVAHPVAMGEGRMAEALELLLQAGQGLAAAHAQEVSHRDFKPKHVLIGADGRVRLVDFDLARAAQAELEVELPPTRTGTVVEASVYVAPEQCAGEPGDDRSDQFSFCVTAWEVLFGVRPHQRQHSERLVAASQAGSRRPEGVAVPAQVQSVLRRGLSARPDARHRTMVPLLEALQRALYVLRGRTAPRRRWSGWRYLGISVLLGGGALGVNKLNSIRLAQECVAQGDAIDEIWNDSARATLRSGLSATKLGHTLQLADDVVPWLDKHAASWREHALNMCMNATVHRTWSPQQADKARWCLEDRRVELAALVSQLAQADDTVAQNATEAAAGLARTETCVDSASLASMVSPPELARRPALERIRAELSRARALQATGKFTRALELARTAREAAETLAWVPLIAAARAREASLLANTGDYRGAESAGERAFIEASESSRWEVAASAAVELSAVVGAEQQRYAQGLLWAKLGSVAVSHAGDPLELREAARLRSLGSVHKTAGEYAQALAVSQEALAIQKIALGSSHPETAFSYASVGFIHLGQGEHDDALGLLQKALGVTEQTLGARHPEVAAVHNGIGKVYLSTGQYDEALAAFERAVVILRDTVGEQHPNTARCYDNIGSVYRRNGQHDEALRFTQKAASILERSLGPGHPDTAVCYGNVGVIYHSKGELEAALKYFRKALAIEEATLGSKHPGTAASYGNLGLVYTDLGDYEEALKYHGRALAVREDTLGKHHPDTAESYNNIGGVYGSQGEHERALEFYLRALAVKEAVLGKNHPATAVSYNNVGGGYLDTGDEAKALEFFHRAGPWSQASRNRKFVPQCRGYVLAQRRVRQGAEVLHKRP